MATIKGIWTFVEAPNTNGYLPYDVLVNFTSNNTEFFGVTCMTNPIEYVTDVVVMDGTPRIGGCTSVYRHDATLYWVDEAYRTVDFGETEQEVPDDFYAWFAANAVAQPTEVIYRVSESTLTAICDKVRELTGTTDKLALANVPTGISDVYDAGKASVVVPSKYCRSITLGDLNLFGTETVTLDLDNATHITNLVYPTVTNETVKHLIVNFKQPIQEFVRVFSNTIPYLERVTLNADLSQATISGNIFWNVPDLKIIDGTPIDLSGAGSGFHFIYGGGNLQEVRFVAGTMKVAMNFSSCKSLSAESIQSIVDGLADLTGQTAQTVRFHTDVVLKLTESQYNQIADKNWEVG